MRLTRRTAEERYHARPEHSDLAPEGTICFARAHRRFSSRIYDAGRRHHRRHTGCLAGMAAGVRRGDDKRQVQGCFGRADDTGRGHRLGENPRARVTLPEGWSHRHGSADVEFLLPLQAEATDRPELSAQVMRPWLW